jgi:hypothetical protein
MTTVCGSPDLAPGTSVEVLTSIGGKLTIAGLTGGGPPGGNLPAVVFEPDPTTASTAITSARSANQMTSDGTAAALGLTNLSSDTTGGLGPNTGLYATVSGGDQNSTTPGASTPDYAVVAGGRQNTASAFGAVVGGGTSNSAGGGNNATVAGGSTNTAAAVDATVGGGQGNSASASHATVAGGNSNVASGAGATVSGGLNNHATGPDSYAEGENNTSSGEASHVEGSANLSNGLASHAEGAQTTSSGQGSHAEGFLTTATGDFSHARGTGTTAQAQGSSAAGEGAFAYLEGQAAHASGYDAGGVPTSITCKQTSVLVMRGETPGAVAGETVELLFGGDGAPATEAMALVTGKSYTVSVEAIAQGIIVPAGQEAQSLYAKACVKCILGVATLSGTGAAEAFGDAALAGSSLSFSVSTNFLHISYTNPEAVTAVVDVVARVTVTETN